MTLITPTDLWLGRPLPYQLPNLPPTHPWAPELSMQKHSSVMQIWGIMLSFPRLSPSQGQIIDVLLSLPPCTEYI